MTTGLVCVNCQDNNATQVLKSGPYCANCYAEYQRLCPFATK
jgi:hypothetical protein